MSTPRSTNPLKTLGLSPKAILAFAVPAISAGVASVGSFLATSNWNPSETRTLLVGIGAAFLAGVGAFSGRPGNVVPNVQRAASGTTYRPEP